MTAPAASFSDPLPWWRFLPREDGRRVHDAAAIGEAGAEGKGALARCLRDARHVVGAGRATAALQAAETAAGRPFGRPLRLLLVCARQPGPLLDALSVAFAIAGFTLETRSIDGLAAAARAAADETSDLFDAIDLTLFSLEPRSDDDRQADVFAREVATAIAARGRAPVAVARFMRAGRPPAIPAEPSGVRTLWIDGGDDPVLDRRFAASFGAILSARAADRLADAAAAFAAEIKGLAPKLLVTDLDGTFWSGVLGETFSGAVAPPLNEAYAAVLATLRDRGVVLAVASRNDAPDVEAAFAPDRGWPVERGDFAAFAVGWEDKAVLVADVLAAVGLAADHAVFVDDDPVNCAKVAARFPGMDVRRFAGDPDRFAAALLADPLLWGTETRSPRAGHYRLKAEVERLRRATPDIAAFLQRLRTTVTVRRLDAGLVARAAELAARVNQFVFTDLRPNALQLAARRNGLDFMVRLDDAFGAHGLVGLVLASERDGEVSIDNLFLSCRALERSVDGAMLWALGRLAADRGLARIRGRIECLPRNLPARDCLARHGFLDHDGEWVYDLQGGGMPGSPGGGPPAISIEWDGREEEGVP